VCELIRTDPLTRHTRILAISGNPDPQYQTRIRAAGADDFLPKPFELEELVSRLKALLRKPVEARR